MPALNRSQFEQQTLFDPDDPQQGRLFDGLQYETGPVKYPIPKGSTGERFNVPEIHYEVNVDDEDDDDKWMDRIDVRAKLPSGRTVGTLEVGGVEDDSETNLGGQEIKWVHTDPSYQRMGIPTQMMNEARSKYPQADIQHSGHILSDGAKWRDSDPHLGDYRSPGGFHPKAVHHRKHVGYQPTLNPIEFGGVYPERSTNPFKGEGYGDASDPYDRSSDWAIKVDHYKYEGYIPDKEQVREHRAMVLGGDGDDEDDY